jgi:hypothetical protein
MKCDLLKGIFYHERGAQLQIDFPPLPFTKVQIFTLDHPNVAC